MEQMSIFNNDEVFIVVDLETTGLNPFEGYIGISSEVILWNK